MTKRTLLALLVALAGLLAFALQAGAQRPVPFADPFILVDGGTYYLYGTHSDSGICVLTSKDMKTWEWPSGKGGYLALSKENSFGEKWFWAPEVYKRGDKYYMYYSAQEHICVAVADSPLGPFVQAEKKPMLDESGIDDSIFTDDDGKEYVFWVRFNHGNEIWQAELEPDHTTIRKETMKLCVRMSQDWEKIWPAVNEGPEILKHKGKYYLTYSANSYESQDYGIGYAVSSSIDGPWEKYEGNPIFRRPGDLLGVGHHAFFTDLKGKKRVVFHSHNSSTRIHPRLLHITTYKFGAGGRMKISDKYFTPELVK